MESNTYLRDSWSQLDFIIVAFSLMDISMPDSDLSFIKIIRMLRILRPLRFISHNPGMKVIVNSLLESVKGIFNVVTMIFFIWYNQLNIG
jgi:hypothetical protein